VEIDPVDDVPIETADFYLIFQLAIWHQRVTPLKAIHHH